MAIVSIGVDAKTVSDTPSTESLSPSVIDETGQRMVCLAHLLRYGRSDGGALAIRRRMRKHIKALPLLQQDCLFQDGIKQRAADGPVVINMCKLRRESYTCRSVELKLQVKYCWGKWILMGNHGLKFPGRRTHLISILGDFDKEPGGAIEQRRQRKVQAVDSSVGDAQSTSAASARQSTIEEDSRIGDPNVWRPGRHRQNHSRLNYTRLSM